MNVQNTYSLVDRFDFRLMKEMNNELWITVDILVNPTASACSFPSAYMATTVSLGIFSTGSLAPGEVIPGHIISKPKYISKYSK
jgi:hypothetical protein